MASITYTPYQEAENALKQAQQEALAAQQAASSANLVGLDTQRQQTNQAADKNAGQLYQNLLTGQRGLANQNQAGGLFESGYAETSNVALQNNYGTNLNNSELQRQQTLQGINDTQQKYILQGQADTANINSNYSQQLVGLKQQQEQQAEALKQQEYQNAITAAEMGDYTKLDAIGGDSSYLRAYNASKLQQQQAQAAAASASARAASSSGTGKSTANQAQVERGIREAQAAINIYRTTHTARQMAQELERQKPSYTNLYGADFWDAYYNYMVEYYPGMSTMGTELSKNANNLIDFISNNKDSYFSSNGVNQKNLGTLLLNASYLSDDERTELWNSYQSMGLKSPGDWKAQYTMQRTTQGGHYSK